MLSPMPSEFEPTRATLHAYALAVSTIPRIHAEPHEKWWHVALTVGPNGWSTDPMALPDGRTLTLRFDLSEHMLVLDTDDDRTTTIPLDQGLTGTEFGDHLIGAIGGLGLEGDYARDKFENDEPRAYERDAASAFAVIVSDMAEMFEAYRAELGDACGRLNLWPHGFDLALEWLGTRVETYEEHGEIHEYPSQINLGFYPGGRAYVYSNPWPFESEILLAAELPHDAEWHSGGWEGSVYHYDLLAGDPDGKAKLIDYARAVHAVAAPTLLTD